jgi:ariadne-1
MSDDEAEYVYEEDEVEYSSQDGEDHSNSNYEESSVKFRIPDGDYKILLYKDIQPLMESHTRDVSNLFSIAFDVANILLRKYKWNKERLIDVYYNDTEEILKEAGVSNQEPSTSPSPSSSIRCRICGDLFGKDDCYSLNCQHSFCKGCYGTYLTHQINDGPPCVFAHCPEYKCKQAITISAVQSLCSQETYEKYMMYITRNFIETSASMRWCPSPGCERVAIGSGVTTVLCQCNFPFCFRCGQEAHDPATCAHLSLWQEKCSNESETANWILANTKKCPKCHTRIEKNQGCNHMNCKMCKHEFCWICMGSWSDHGQNTGGYYKCNKYDPQNSDNNAAKAKAELDR